MGTHCGVCSWVQKDTCGKSSCVSMAHLLTVIPAVSPGLFIASGKDRISILVSRPRRGFPCQPGVSTSGMWIAAHLPSHLQQRDGDLARRDRRRSRGRRDLLAEADDADAALGWIGIVIDIVEWDGRARRPCLPEVGDDLRAGTQVAAAIPLDDPVLRDHADLPAPPFRLAQSLVLDADRGERRR